MRSSNSATLHKYERELQIKDSVTLELYEYGVGYEKVVFEPGEVQKTESPSVVEDRSTTSVSDSEDSVEELEGQVGSGLGEIGRKT